MQKQTVQQLKRKILELESQTILNLNHAAKNISKAGEPLFASACIVQISALGGREILPAFCIYDGLSPDTIEAIKQDIIRTCNRIKGN